MFNKILFFFLFCIASVSAYECDLAVVTIFRDEAPYIKQWIEYHRLIGVQRFYLVDHLSSDGVQQILKPYIDEGIVYYSQSKEEPNNLSHWNRIQISAYNNVINVTKDRVKWLAVIDSDEYLLPTQDCNVVEILSNYEDFAGLAVNWQLFGTSYVEKIAPNQLMMEALTYKAPADFYDNTYVKLIVQPKYIHAMLGPHTCKLSSSKPIVTTSKQVVTRKRSSTVDVSLLRLNHYWTRDMTYVNTVKMQRMRQMGAWLKYMYNKMHIMSTVPDDLILRYVPKLRERVYE